MSGPLAQSVEQLAQPCWYVGACCARPAGVKIRCRAVSSVGRAAGSTMLVRRCVLRTPRRDKNQMSGPLAQSVEQLAFNQLVVGSNPTRPTTFQPVSQAGSTSWSLVRIQHGPPG